MRCPICGSKMVQGQLCKYCNVTADQVNNASNKLVKSYRKNDMSDLIYFTNVVPNDVNKIKLLLFTIFFGIIGVNHYYVNRNIRGTYSLLSTVLSITFLTLKLTIKNIYNITAFKLVYEIIFLCMAINVILWFCDILNVIFHKFKVPVVLADKEGK